MNSDHHDADVADVAVARQQQEKQLQEEQNELVLLFLNNIQQDHDNAIISYYQNRNFKTTQTHLVQILNDLRSYDSSSISESNNVYDKNEANSSLTTQQGKLWYNNSIRPKRLLECNGTAISASNSVVVNSANSDHQSPQHQQQQPVNNTNDIPASNNVVTLESLRSSQSTSSSSFQHQEQQLTDHFENTGSVYSDDEIYDGAMLLGNATIVPNEMYEIATVVMFNLALVHQQLYFAGESSQLDKSIRIYRQAIAVLEGSTYILSCRALQILLCASYHNCGQMYISEPTIFDLHQTSVLFDRVQTILVYLIEQNKKQKRENNNIQESCLMEIETELDVRFFYRNLLFARISIQNGQSAAA
jgi:hypothetical protein